MRPGLDEAILAQFACQVLSGHAVGLCEFVNACLVAQLEWGLGFASAQGEQDSGLVFTRRGGYFRGCCGVSGGLHGRCFLLWGVI